MTAARAREHSPIAAAGGRAECPRRALRLRQVSLRLPRIDRLRTTQEDRLRSESYEHEANRRSLLKQATSLEEFYSSLDMVAEISELREEDVDRVQQLVAKTNQFNLTLKRYSEPEIRQLKRRSDAAILTLRLRDRLGRMVLSPSRL